MLKALSGDATDLKPKFKPHYLSGLAARAAGGGIDVAHDGEGASFAVRFAAATEEAAPSALTAS
jgi:hypothetical protein